MAIDTLHGTLEADHLNRRWRRRSARCGLQDAEGQFGGAVFKLNQQTRGAGKGLVTLMLALSAFKGAPSQAICKK